MDLQLPKRKQGGGMNWETEIDTCTLPAYKIMRTYCIAWELHLVLCGDLKGKSVKEEMYVYI